MSARPAPETLSRRQVIGGIREMLDAKRASHTPGPWHVELIGFHRNRVWTEDMLPVANLCSFGSAPPDIDPTAQANARLIAAAPELLSTLIAIEQAYRNRHSPQHRAACLAQAGAVIAKATGNV